MFRLPIKQIVINSDSVVDLSGLTGGAAATAVVGEIIKIEGYGDFAIPAAADAVGHKTVAADAVAGVFDITPPTVLAAGEIWSLRLTFSQGPRVLSDVWTYGEKRTFQSKALTTAPDAEAWVDAFVAGLNDVDPEYFGMENVLAFSKTGAGAGATLTVTFQPGYEGMGIKLAEAVEGSDITGPDQRLAIAETTAPSEGINLGKQIEAEVRNATFDNIDPYGIQFGGNAPGVDVRGKYTEIHWAAAPYLNGWEPHAMTGYGDANTEANHAATEHSAFCNEGTVSAAIIDALELLAVGK